MISCSIFFLNLHMQKCIRILHPRYIFIITCTVLHSKQFLFITVVFVIATIYLDRNTKNPNTDILLRPKLTNQKPGTAKRSLKKSNVKHIYFVNNSPDTIGARTLTIKVEIS